MFEGKALEKDQVYGLQQLLQHRNVLKSPDKFYALNQIQLFLRQRPSKRLNLLLTVNHKKAFDYTSPFYITYMVTLLQFNVNRNSDIDVVGVK